MAQIEVAILCGGPGTRMGSRIHSVQKCMLQVGGKPILEHVLDSVTEAFGHARVTFITSYRATDISFHFGSSFRDLELRYAHCPQVVGTRRALLKARKVIDSDFLMIHGDVICHPDGMRMLFETQREHPLGAVLYARTCDAAPTHGIVRCEGTHMMGLEYPPTRSPVGEGEGRYMGVDAQTLDREVKREKIESSF